MKIELATKAHDLYRRIIDIKDNVAKEMWTMIGLFKVIRDEKLYADLGCDSFSEFLADPYIGLRPQTVRNYITMYELYVDKLGVPSDRLLSIGMHKLQEMATVVESNPSRWLDIADSYSPSDFTNEVRAAKGKEPMQKSSPPPDRQLPSPGPHQSYVEYAKNVPCILCGRTPVDLHHFPVTRGAGAREEAVIPLCRLCHSEYHQNPTKWENTYRKKWGNYMWGLILDNVFKGE